MIFVDFFVSGAVYFSEPITRIYRAAASRPRGGVAGFLVSLVTEILLSQNRALSKTTRTEQSPNTIRKIRTQRLKKKHPTSSDVGCFSEFVCSGTPSVSRIMFASPKERAAVIRLGRRSHAASSHLPATGPGRSIGCLFDVAPRRDCPFHPTRSRLVSVALILASRRTGVTCYGALRSPDFPPAA